jgi:APA family basic amino acid/polyamine antiporter
MAGAPSDAKLIPKRKLGFVMCVALVVGNMIGTGIFQLPRNLAPMGWNGVFGWVATIGGTLCLAIVLLRLARGRADGCGAYTYPAAAFGPGTGFVVAWSYWISCWTVNATLAVAVVQNMAFIWPGLAAPGIAAPAALAILWLFTFINCLGVREAGKVQVLTSVLKLVPLAGALLVAFWLLARGDAVPVQRETVPIAAGSIQAAATLALFAMLSFESAMVAGDRVENPERNVPRATMWGTLIAGLFYLLCSSAVTLLLPHEAVAQTESPFALFFSTLVHPALGPVIAVFVAIAALGALNGIILVQAEMPLALAREGLLPAWFARFNRREIPWRIHLISSGLATLLLIANYMQSLASLFTFMVLVTTSVSLIFYLTGTLAALWLRVKGRLDGNAGFIPVALVAVAYCLWAFYGAGPKESLWSFGMTAVAIPVYLFMTATDRLARIAAWLSFPAVVFLFRTLVVGYSHDMRFWTPVMIAGLSALGTVLALRASGRFSSRSSRAAAGSPAASPESAA